MHPHRTAAAERRLAWGSIHLCAAVLASVVTLGALACSHGGDATGLIQPRPPAALIIEGGDGQSAVVGHELPQPVRVRVVDADGHPVPGQIVNFRVISGGGSAFAGAAITTDAGRATERWTLGTSTSGDQRLEARAVDPNTGVGLVFGVFQATALPDAPASLTKVGGDGLSVTAGTTAADSLAARVVDKYGNGVPAISVAWAVASGGGTVRPAASVSNATGIAKASWTVGTSGAIAQQVTATVSALTPATFTATITAAAAAQLALAQPAAGAVTKAAFTQQPVVRVTDAYGNLVTSSSDAVTASVSTGGTLMGTQTVNAVNGVATFGNLGVDATPGTYTLTYTATLGGTARTVTQSITVAAGPGNHYVVTASNNHPIAGTTLRFTAQLVDAYGNPAPESGHRITWTLDFGQHGSFATASSLTDASGAATADFTTDTIAPQNTTILATDDLNRILPKTVRVIGGPAVKLAFATQPANTGFEIATPVRVTAQDRYGNTDTTFTGTVTLSIGNNPSAANLSGGGTVAFNNGAADFPNAALDQAGTGYTLVAATTFGGLPPVTSTAFNVSAIGVVASIQGSVFLSIGLTVDGQSVYFSDGSRLAKVSVFGGTPLVIDSWSGGSGSARVVSDGTFINVLFKLGSPGTEGSSGGIRRVPINGGPATTVGFHSGSGKVEGLGPSMELDGTYLYTTLQDSSNKIVRFRTTDGVEETYVDKGPHDSSDYALYVRRIAVDRGQVYYRYPAMGDYAGGGLHNTTIETYPAGGAAAFVVRTTSVDAQGPRAIAVANNTIFWVDVDTLGRPRLRSAPTAGGTPTTLAAEGGNVLVTDGTYVYLGDRYRASLHRVEIATGKVTSIVEGDQVADIALAGSAVYWTIGNFGGPQVKKARR